VPQGKRLGFDLVRTKAFTTEVLATAKRYRPVTQKLD
jgi:hypothetical protein